MCTRGRPGTAAQRGPHGGHCLGARPGAHPLRPRRRRRCSTRCCGRSGAGGFRHNEQSLRVVDRLENDGAGLNLTWEVRDGIRNHTGEVQPATLEAGSSTSVTASPTSTMTWTMPCARVSSPREIFPRSHLPSGGTGSERIDTWSMTWWTRAWGGGHMPESADR